MFIKFSERFVVSFTVPTTDVCNHNNFSFKVKIYIDFEVLTVVMLTSQLFLDVVLCRLVLFLVSLLYSWTHDNWVPVNVVWRVLRFRREVS
jgi:hypothetical protein